MAQIILTHKDKVVSKHTITSGSELSIGRQHGNDIIIDNLAVSGRHALIRHEKEGLFLTDAGSTNGTFVNSERVTKCRLVHQDLVTIGNHALIVDIYGTLTLEGTMRRLIAGTVGVKEADQTIMFGTTSNPAAPPAFDRLTFISGGQGEYEILKNIVTIGKNPEADIVIGGFWAFLSGAPAATIERRGGNYFLNYNGGMLKPKVNDFPVASSTKINHNDIVKVGPVTVKLQVSRRPKS
jgi:pSer/pThr/pTyr-binding forkhead associated (FHA) protein